MRRQIDSSTKEMLINRFVNALENRGIYVPLEVREKLLDQQWRSEDEMRRTLLVYLDEIDKKIEVIKKYMREMGYSDIPRIIGYLDVDSIKRAKGYVRDVMFSLHPYTENEGVKEVFRELREFEIGV